MASCSLNRVYCFFGLFCAVYFLESIGGFYMISAVQSIERQFQIPSRMSGLMVSAGDFGYIPTVVIISYMGSKGNRARWIGGGCLLIALSNFLVSTPNFIFPVEKPELNTSVIEIKMMPTNDQIMDSIEAFNFVRTLSPELSDQFIDTNTNTSLRRYIDSIVGDPNCENVATKHPSVNETELCRLLRAFIEKKRNEHRPSQDEVMRIRQAAAAPFGVCNALVNQLRMVVEKMKCSTHPSNTGPFTLIFIALLFLGVGRTMPWSLGVPLIDDNVKRKNLPVYFAGMFFIRILGPILGFVIGSVCNRLYYTLETPQGLSPRDPTWIGAWWLGFFGIAVVMFGPSLGLFCFPTGSTRTEEMSEEANGDSRTPRNDKKRSLALIDRHASKNADGKAIVPEGVCDKISDFAASMLKVLKTPVYSGALVGRILDVLAFKGFFLFLPKYVENQFGIPQYKVQIYLAVSGVSGFASGVLVGSVVMRKFKLEGRRAATFVAVCSAVAACLSFSKSLVGCNSLLTTVGTTGIATNYNYTSGCNANCFCDQIPLFPVCSKTSQKVFYSPCHAGCRNMAVPDLTNLNMEFENCSCLDNGETVSRDFCPDDCDSMSKIYFGLFTLAGLVGGMGVIPGILIILRAVPAEHRSISLGFSGFLVSLLATLPSPILWGFIVDSACLIWEKTCTGLGSCVIYEASTMRLRMHIAYGMFRAVAVLSDIWVWYFAKDLKLMTEEDDEDETKKDLQTTL